MSDIDLDAPGVLKKIAREIVEDIDSAAQEMYDEPFRTHLGASIIGDACYRKLWFNFRWAMRINFDGRMMRLFNRGHKEEQRFIEWLTYKGYKVNAIDPETGKQWRVNGLGGHFGGSQDGEVYLPEKFGYSKPLLCEFKTNATGMAFNKVKDTGVIVGKPVHTDQMDTYGYYKKYTHALYLMVNKNDDDIACEIVKLDWTRGKKLEDKARVIILSQVSPPRVAENPAAQACKFCDYAEVCYFKQPLEKNCRSCSNASPKDNKEWHCAKWDATIPAEAIYNGCPEWNSIYKP